MKKFLVGLLVSATIALPADFLSFGIKGGIPLNDAFNTSPDGYASYSINTARYTVGPEVELKLPFGLGLEVDTLYRRLGYDFTTNIIPLMGISQLFTSSQITANAWDVPLLLKYRFLHGPFRPYVSAGPSFRFLTNVEGLYQNVGLSLMGATFPSTPPELQNRFDAGFTANGGV
ncbi:MAG: outer membrane beta-barrel protein, partial [Bryobacteraceae bacterium]